MVVGAARAAAAAPVTSMMQAQRRGCNDETARSVATVNQLASAARHQMRSAAVHHYLGHTAVSAELRAYKQNKQGVGGPSIDLVGTIVITQLTTNGCVCVLAPKEPLGQHRREFK